MNGIAASWNNTVSLDPDHWDQLGFAVLCLDSSDRISLVSRRFQTISGLDSRSVEGKPFSAVASLRALAPPARQAGWPRPAELVTEPVELCLTWRENDYYSPLPPLDNRSQSPAIQSDGTGAGGPLHSRWIVRRVELGGGTSVPPGENAPSVLLLFVRPCTEEEQPPAGFALAGNMAALPSRTAVSAVALPLSGGDPDQAGLEAEGLPRDLQQGNAGTGDKTELIALLDLIPVGAALWDEHDRLRHANSALHMVMGKAIDVLKVGSSFLEVSETLAAAAFSDPAMAEIQVRRRLVCHRNPGQTMGFQLESGRKIEVTDHSLPDGSILSLYKDVTEAIASREKMESSLYRMAVAEKLTGIGRWEWTARLGNIQWSHPTFNLLGFPEKDGVPSAPVFLASIHPDDRERVSEAIHAMRRGDLGPDFVFRIQGETGRWKVIHSQSRVERDPGGHIARVIGTFQDITSLRQLSEALEGSEKMRSAVLNATADAVFVHDVNGRLIEVNPAACDVVGFNSDELLTMEVFDLQRRPDRDKAQSFWAGLPPDHCVTEPACMMRRDGSEFPTEIRLRRFESARGSLFVASVRDISARLESEQRAEQAESRMTSAVENIADGVVLLDDELRLLILNQVWRDQVGLPDNIPLPPGTPFHTVVDMMWKEGVVESLDGIAGDWRDYGQKALRTVNRPFEIACRDGRRLMVRKKNLDDGQIMLIQTDITAIRRRDAELERLFRFGETLSSVLPSPAFAFDREGRIMFANPALCRLLNCSAASLLGGSALRIYSHFIYGETWQADLASLADSSGNRVRQTETRFRGEEGGLKDILMARAAYGDDQNDLAGVICVLTDISVTKQTERRFQDFADASSDWFWETDSSNRFVFVSDSVETHIGIRPTMLLGHDRWDFLHGEGGSAVAQRHQEDLEARRPFRDFRYHAHIADGTTRAVSVSGKPFYDEDGVFCGYRGTAADITERLAIEKALHQSERAMRSVIDAVNDSILLIRPDGKIRLGNRASATLYGEDAEALVGRPLFSFLEAGMQARFRERIQEVVESGQPWREELNRNGFWLEDMLYPVMDELGQVTALTLFSRDISERRRNEQAVEESIRRYRRLFEATEVAFVNVDLRPVRTRLSEFRAEGIQDLQRYLAHRPDMLDDILASISIVDMNDAAPRLFGFRDHGDLQRSFIDLFTASARVTMAELLQAFWEDRTQLRAECQLQKPDKDPLHVQMACPVPGEFNDCAYVPLSFSDITRIKKTQRDLTRARDLAEQANRTKSAFLANMSHELRTPLNAIIGFGQIIENAVFGDDIGPRYREYAGDIVKGANILMEIITEILDFARVEQHAYQVKPVALDLVPLIQDVISLVREPARKRGVVLNAGSMPERAIALADSRATRQIMINLCANAVKFTPEGGTVTVDVRPDDEGWNLAVRDTGIGIAPEDLSRIFEPFVQVARESGKYHEGTGLGLPLCEKLSHLMHGSINVVSSVGEGSCFTLYLPSPDARLAEVETDIPGPDIAPAGQDPDAEGQVGEEG